MISLVFVFISRRKQLGGGRYFQSVCKLLTLPVTFDLQKVHIW